MDMNATWTTDSGVKLRVEALEPLDTNRGGWTYVRTANGILLVPESQLVYDV